MEVVTSTNRTDRGDRIGPRGHSLPSREWVSKVECFSFQNVYVQVLRRYPTTATAKTPASSRCDPPGLQIIHHRRWSNLRRGNCKNSNSRPHSSYSLSNALQFFGRDYHVTYHCLDFCSHLVLTANSRKAIRIITKSLNKVNIYVYYVYISTYIHNLYIYIFFITCTYHL